MHKNSSLEPDLRLATSLFSKFLRSGRAARRGEGYPGLDGVLLPIQLLLFELGRRSIFKEHGFGHIDMYPQGYEGPNGGGRHLAALENVLDHLLPDMLTGPILGQAGVVNG